MVSIMRMDFIVPIALKLIASNTHFLKFRVAYFASFGIVAFIEPSMNFQAFRRSRRADEIHHDLVRLQGDASPVRVMWQNKRCSILFHLLVPGGKWQTSTIRPVRLANR